jgi:hypothetical protein
MFALLEMPQVNCKCCYFPWNNVSTLNVHQKLHEMGFHGRAAAHKPKNTMRNAKRRLEWGKACHY